jgi:hypothetical protein
MPITIDTIVTFSLGGTLGFLAGAIVVHFLAKSRAAEDREAKRFDEAATIFRRALLTELEGIYPVTSAWDSSVNPRFRQSIPKIESAAAAFRYFVKSKTEFDTAIKEYRDYCSKVTFEGVAAWQRYTAMREPGDIGPVEKFKNVIEHLLSFVERK